MNKAVIALLLAVGSLMALGFLMLASLYSVHSGGPHRHLLPANLITWQIMGAGVGLVLMSEISRVDYRRWQPIATRFAGVVFMLLVLVLIPGMGPAIKGLRRWLYLGSSCWFQPSILAGIALVLLMAWWYRDGKDRPGYFFWIPFSFILLWSGIVFCEPDITTALLLLLTGWIMMILGREKICYLLLYFFWVANGLVWLILQDPVRRDRIYAMSVNPSEHVDLPLYTQALAAGGWSGVGLGKGHYVGCFLPEAGTEFMSAFIGEELGMCALLAMMVLYAVIAGCGLYIGAKAPDRFGALLAYGIVTWTMMPVLLTLLFLTTLINIHFPLLPFVSGGGLHLGMSLIGVGVLLNIARTKGGAA